MNNNKIGVYNLNNPFSQNVRHEEQLKAYRGNIRERTMNLLSNYAPRIKEETCNRVLKKIEPILVKNSNCLSELKIQSEKICEHFLLELMENKNTSLDCLNQQLIKTKENFGEMKENIFKNSFNPGGDNSSLEDQTENILNNFDQTLQGVQENSKIYSFLLNHTNQTSKLMELKIFLSEKIKKIYETFYTLNSLPSEEVILLEKLKITLEKIEALMSLQREGENIIESCTSTEGVFLNSNKISGNPNPNPISNNLNSNNLNFLKNSKFSSNFKFDIQSIPSYYSGLKNIK
jgi:hypothetical protein